MVDNLVRLRLESSEYDQKLKRAAEGLQRFADGCRKVGGTMEVVEKDTLDYVRAIGQMETHSHTATGKLNEMKKAFVEFSSVYRNMTEAEKQSPVGRALSQSLDQLKVRINDSKNQLAEINRELSDSKFGQFGSVIDGIGQKFGITGNLTEMLTSKTALLTGAIGAVGTAVAYATNEWAAYNHELAKQDQITTVTTGLKGDDAERMTSAMRALSRTYGADFREAVNAANMLMSQFGTTGDEAIQLLRDGMQGMIIGDAPKLLQMIQQFTPAFHDAGVSASQLVAVIQNSEGGLFTDQNMNAIVMGIKNIRLMTKQTSEALAKLGIDGQEMSRKMSDGSLSVFDALKQVSSQLKGVGSGSQTAGEVMQAVFGRQGAMAGTNLAKAIETLNTDLSQTKTQTGELGKSLADLQAANERLEVAIRNCFGYNGWETMTNGIKTDLMTTLSNVLEITNQIKESWVGEIAGTIFDSIIEGAKRAYRPLFAIYEIMTKIKLFDGDNKNNGIGYSDIEKRIANISKLGTKEEREKQYNLAIDEINWKINNLGKDRWRKNADGSTSNYILSADEQAKNRNALERRRQILENHRESIINGTKTDTKTPVTPLPTTPKNHKLTDTEKTQQKFDQAQKDYQQALEQAALEVKAGTITQAEAKKKELQATESLWKSIGDARETYDSPKLKEAQAKVEKDIVRLGGEVTKTVEAQKRVEQAARELEQAQKKLADAQRELATARESGKLKDIYAAEKKVAKAQEEVTRLETIKVNVEKGTVDLPDIPKEVEQIVSTKVGEVITPDVATGIVQTISTRLGDIVTPEIAEQLTQTINTKVGEVVTPDVSKELTQVVNVEPGMVDLPDIPEEVNVPIVANTENIDAEIAHLKEKLGSLEIGSIDFNLTQGNLVDMTTLQTIINTQMKAGLKIDPEITKNLMNQIISGADIVDSTWKDLVNSINEKLKELDIEPINIDFKTGNIAKDGKNAADSWKSAASAISSVGGALQSIEDPAGKIAGLVAQAIATVAQAYAQALSTDWSTKSNIWSFIGAAAASTASMITTISAIHSATGYAQGGIVKGNSYSGDNIPAMVGGPSGELVGLNAGEVVLNHAQQNTLANELQGNRGFGNMQIVGVLEGEKIKLVLNRYLMRTGQGELVTW